MCVCVRVYLDRTNNLLPISHADRERLNYNGTSDVINLPIYCILYLARGTHMCIHRVCVCVCARFIYLQAFKYVINTFFHAVTITFYWPKRAAGVRHIICYVFGKTHTTITCIVVTRLNRSRGSLFVTYST